MEKDLNDDQQKVWDILSTPYVPPTAWDDMSPDAISKLIEEIKLAMVKAPTYKEEFKMTREDVGMTREEWDALR